MMRALLALLLSVALTGAAQTYVVAAGVEQYDDPAITSLRYAVADVTAVAKAFTDAGIPAGNVTVLTSDQVDRLKLPTTNNILMALNRVRTKAVAGDVLVFLFSGHGMQKLDQPYLLTVDSNREQLEETALPMRAVTKALTGFQGDHVLFIIDACRNDPDAGKAAADASLDEQFAKGLRPKLAAPGATREPVVATLLACDAGQRAYEMPEEQHGAFTWYLIKGLRGEAAGADGTVTLNGLTDYVGREVTSWAERARRTQTPRFERGGAADFAVLKPPDMASIAITLLNRDYPPQQVLAAARKAVAQRPNDARAHGVLAYSLSYLNRAPQEAEATARKALALDEQGVWGHLALANLARHSGDQKKAEAEARRAVAVAPEQQMGYFELAWALRDANRNAEAVAAIHQGLAACPNDPDMLDTAANYLRYDFPAEAAQLYQRAVGMAPGEGFFKYHLLYTPGVDGLRVLDQAAAVCDADDPRPYIWRSSYLAYVKNDFPAAEKVLRQGVAALPDVSVLHDKLAYVLYRLDKPDEAAAEYRRATTLDPESAVSWRGLGWSYSRLKQYADAERCYRRALELLSGSAVNYCRGELAYCLADQNRVNEAEAEFWKMIETAPRDAYPRGAFAGFLHGRERYSEALEHYRKAADLDPEASYRQTDVARCLEKLNRLDEAEAAWRKAIELEPGNATSRAALADLLMKRERHSEALEYYRRAAELEPKVGWRQISVADCLVKLNRTADAEATYVKAVAELPEDDGPLGSDQRLQ